VTSNVTPDYYLSDLPFYHADTVHSNPTTAAQACGFCLPTALKYCSLSKTSLVALVLCVPQFCLVAVLVEWTGWGDTTAVLRFLPNCWWCLPRLWFVEVWPKHNYRDFVLNLVTTFSFQLNLPR
jgi:hypothetical protein